MTKFYIIIVLTFLVGMAAQATLTLNHLEQNTKSTACYLLNQNSTNPNALQECLSDE